jgi:phosphohistidine phosphatase
MNLYFLRHAIAVPRGTAGYKDEKRPLTKDGIRKMKEIAEGMLQLEMELDRIASSPLLRARQTAEIAAAAFHQEIEIWKSLDPSEDPRQLVAALRKSNDNNILLVGHEPHLSQFISVLIAGNSDVQIEFKKGGLCRVSTDDLIYGPCAVLHWLLAPSQLRKLA